MWSSGTDFLQLDPRTAPARGLTTWLTDGLRAAVIDGRLPAGAALPPTRALASDLGVSRGVVVEAYQRLKDEGLVSAWSGAGTQVTAAARRPGVVAAAEPLVTGLGTPVTGLGGPAPGVLPRPWRAAAEIDLSPGVPDLSGFPRAAWLRAERTVLAHASTADLGYGDPRGSRLLRTELAAWLARTRGLSVSPDEIIIVTGVAQALTLLAQWLVRSGSSARGLAMEDPGSRGTRDLFAYWGLPPVPIAVDNQGLVVADLAATDVRAVVLTPAHQFPTGALLGPERRRALLSWAARADGLIVEDDYDAEYRYDRSPVPALQASAPDLVLYAGSTSKTLAPGMRLGWLIPPRPMRDDLIAAKHAADLGSPALPQLVLAELIASGALEQHIRLVRKRQRNRRDALLNALRSHVPAAHIEGIGAGLHLLVTLPSLAGAADTELAERVLQAGVLVHPLSWHSQRDVMPGFVLGYAVHTPDQLHEAVRRIAKAIRLRGCVPGFLRGLLGFLGDLLVHLRVGAAVPAGSCAQLEDAGRAGQDDEQDAADRGEQQCHAERKMAVDPEIGNIHGVAVLQDEDQQEQQDNGEAADGDPQAASSGPLQPVLGQLALQRNLGLLRGCEPLSFGSRLGFSARYLTCGARHLLVLEILRRIRHYLAPPYYS